LRVNKLITAGETALIWTRMGKPSLVFSGYQYRILGENSKFVSWVCVKSGNCKGKLKTNVQYEIHSKADRSCVPNLAAVEVKVKLDNCRKRAREDVSVPVGAVCEEDPAFTRKGMAW